MDRYDLSMRAPGRLDMLDDDTREVITKVVDARRHRRGGVLNLCVAYTSRDEIARSVKKTVECCFPVPESITSQSLSENMDISKDPPPDVLIRTSGVNRLSDFLLWQCHQETDIYFVNQTWPDLKYWDLLLIIAGWQRKKAA